MKEPMDIENLVMLSSRGSELYNLCFFFISMLYEETGEWVDDQKLGPAVHASLQQSSLLFSKKKKLRSLSPRENYTDRATATCRRNQWQLLRIPAAVFSDL
jgi:hypothetical protein